MSAWRTTAALAGLLVALAARPAAADVPRVARVDLRLPPGDDAHAVEAIVAIHPGDPLSSHALRRAVQLLYQLGRYRNVVVRVAPGGSQDEVVVTVECLSRRTISSVRYTVSTRPWPLDEERLRRAAELQAGDDADGASINGAAERIRSAYARRGYRAAGVRVSLDGDRQVAVTVSIEPGPVTRVASLELPGAPPLGAGLARLRSRAGEILDEDQLDEDARALRALLRERGYHRARVGTPRVVVRGFAAAVEIPVDAGPPIVMRFAGQAAFDAARLRAELELDLEQPLDEAAVGGTTERLAGFYRRHGYANVRVWAEERPAGSARVITFHVDEGRRLRVREVRFAGASFHDAAWLQTRLAERLTQETRPDSRPDEGERNRLAAFSGLPPVREGPPLPDVGDAYDESTWSRAIAGIVEAYRSEGFLDAAHEGTRVDLDLRNGWIDVEVRLREGTRTRIESIAFEGYEAVSLAELVREATLVPGDPLSFDALEQTRLALLRLYGRRGYLYARVEESEELSADRRTAAVRFRLVEGPRVRIGGVVVSGNKRTREDVVLDALSVKKGDLYDPDMLARSQTALLRLGVFRSVGLRLNDAEVPEATKDLTVEVAERPWQTIAPGIGFSLANGPRAFLELTRPNLLGRALELTARAKVNYPLTAFRPDLVGKPFTERVEGRAEVGLHNPRWHLLPFAAGSRIDAIAERLHRPAYNLTRGSGVAGLDVPISGRTTLSLQYELEVDNIQKTAAFSSIALTRADVERLRFPEGVTTLQSLRPVVAFDFRDNPVHPRRGWFASAIADLSHSIGADPGSPTYTDMLKLSATLSGYVPIGAQSVLAVSFRSGRVLPLDPQSVTIAPKRFFLGGAATMRGYAEDEMFPQDVRGDLGAQVRRCKDSLGADCTPQAAQLAAGQPLASEGGEAFLLLKTELRIPVRGSVEAGIFADLGNLWLDQRAMSLATLRLNVGFGLRFVTPIGPAAFDLGFNVDPDSLIGERVVAPHFSIGLF